MTHWANRSLIEDSLWLVFWSVVVLAMVWLAIAVDDWRRR